MASRPQQGSYPRPGVAPYGAAQPAAPARNNTTLLIAGGAALGLLLLGGVAAMRRRRRRKQDEADEATKMAFIEAAEQEHDEHPAAAEPAFVRAAPRHDPVPVSSISDKTPIADAPNTELPEDFDLSRFGPHVQAAYRGPTEDNPSLSLKHRLRRANFLDQQEKRAVEEAGAMPAPATETAPAKSSWETRSDGEFIFRRAGTKPAEKPVLQDQ